MLNLFLLNIPSSFAAIQILFEVQKMATVVFHCKTDSVNCGTAYCTGDPHHLPRWPPADDTQRPPPPTSPNRWPMSDYASNHQQESAHLPTTIDASSKRSTINWLKSRQPSCNDCIIYAGYFDVAVGREVLRWVGCVLGGHCGQDYC